MKQTAWAVLAAVGVSFAAPALADDPSATGTAAQPVKDQKAEAAADQATPRAPIAEARDGAGSMEPADTKGTDTESAGTESAQDRVERDFVTSVWNSP